MTTERIAELNRIAGFLTETLVEDYADGAVTALREYAALLAKASEGEPDRRTITTIKSGVMHAYVSVVYADWQRAGRLAALLEIEQLKAQLDEAQKALLPFVGLIQEHNEKQRNDQIVFGINDVMIRMVDLRNAQKAARAK